MNEFVFDGCTGFFDVWRGIDLNQCCYAHDLSWYQNPGDWSVWLSSNIDLVACFYQLGVWEVAIGGAIAVFTIGALLFALPRRKKHDGEVG